MFGYIVINKAEMKFKDFDMYQSYYCGLCNRLKECYGRRGQMTLSYDMTFLIVLLTGLYEPETAVDTVNCIAHPFEKHTARTNEYSDYAASMNLILTYYKCKDDWNDERKKKSYAVMQALKPKMKEIKEQYPEKISRVSANLQKLSILETENEQNIDLMAGLFGEIMAELFVYRKDEWEEKLRRMGFFFGKFIYLMDAYEDIEEDLKQGRYNPLAELYNKDSFEEDCQQILKMMMAETSRTFEMLPILEDAEILRNILYAGVWTRYGQIRCKRKEKVKES